MHITILSLWAHKLFRSDEPQPFGGAELQLVLLSRALVQKKAVQVTFVTRGKGDYEEYNHNGIHIVKLPYHSGKKARSLHGVMDIVKACIKQPTDVYLQRAGGVETGILGFASQRKRKPFVFMTSHNWDVDGTRKKKLGKFGGWLYHYGLHRAHAIVAQTEEQQQKLLQYENLNSVVLRSAHEIPTTIPDEKKGLLWVARCEPWKCPEAFIELAKRMPDVPCTMVCPKANSDEYFYNISSYIYNYKNLKFLPGVSFEKTESLFASHRMFICTSKHEGFPNTFVQAFKWGTPVFSLYLDPDNRLADYGTGICSKGDFSKFAATVDFYYHNMERLQNMIDNGRNYVKEHHDAGKISEKLLQLIKEISDTK